MSPLPGKLTCKQAPRQLSPKLVQFQKFARQLGKISSESVLTLFRQMDY
jgi:hypothetical protein